MSSRLCCIVLGALCAGLLVVGPAATQERDEGAAPPEGVEVQTRGPVHEAFAEPGGARAGESPVVDKEPPAPVQEEPPDEKPDGENVQWIPGYWAWDSDSGQYLWVSGFWRDVPPGRVWVPGTWERVEGGWQWAPGYWSEETREEVDYLPEPPAPVDAGPSTPPPSETDVYVPGCWVWRTTRYLWRPGFWVPFRPGWVWTPAHYSWTPAGYLFVEGFWDYPLHMRGLLFAPVLFDRAVYADRRFVYRPSFVIEPDFLMSALFVRRATREFYFGDYFDRRYVGRGFVSWLDFRPTLRGAVYESNLAYYRHAFARYRGWERGLRDLYDARYRGTVARPPRTLAEQVKLVNTITSRRLGNVDVGRTIRITNLQNVTAVRPLRRTGEVRTTALASLAGVRPTEVRSLGTTRVRVAPMSREGLAQARKSVEHFRSVTTERRNVQSRLLSKGVSATKSDRPARVTFTAPTRLKPATPSKAKPPAAPTMPRHVERDIPRRPDRTPETGRPPDRRPPETGRPPDRRPPETGRPPDRRPPETGRPPDRPPDRRPPETGRPPDRRPPETGRSPDRRPPETGRPPDRRPPETGRPPDRRPPETGRPPDRRPPETGRPPDRRPPETGRPPDRRPPETGRPPDRPPDRRPPETGRAPDRRPPETGRPPDRRPPETGRPPDRRPPDTGRPAPPPRPPEKSRPPDRDKGKDRDKDRPGRTAWSSTPRTPARA